MFFNVQHQQVGFDSLKNWCLTIVHIGTQRQSRISGTLVLVYLSRQVTFWAGIEPPDTQTDKEF